MATFTAIRDRLLVKRLTEDEKTKGGLVIPESAKQKQAVGEIIAAGPGTRDKDGVFQPLKVKVGDKIFFGAHVGLDVRIDQQDYLVMREEDALGVLEA